jgi:hypothetical protein
MHVSRHGPDYIETQVSRRHQCANPNCDIMTRRLDRQYGKRIREKIYGGSATAPSFKSPGNSEIWGRDAELKVSNMCFRHSNFKMRHYQNLISLACASRLDLTHRLSR